MEKWWTPQNEEGSAVSAAAADRTVPFSAASGARSEPDRRPLKLLVNPRCSNAVQRMLATRNKDKYVLCIEHNNTTIQHTHTF
jgi:hypothetical protein